jgi:hypothetical protein
VPCAASASGLVCAMTHAATLQPVLIWPADPIADMRVAAGHFYRQTNPFGLRWTGSRSCRRRQIASKKCSERGARARAATNVSPVTRCL